MRIPNRIQRKLLMFWHAVFSGSFVIAYISEDVYTIHVFAGYVVLAAVVIRVLLGIFSASNTPLSLPNPMAATRIWIDKLSKNRKAQNPFFIWITAALLVVIGLSAISGAIADVLPFIEDLHESVSELTLAVIFGHLGFVFLKSIRHSQKIDLHPYLAKIHLAVGDKK